MPDFSSGTAADLPDDVDAELRQMPGINYLDRIKLIEAQVARTPSPEREAQGTAGGTQESSVIFVIREFSVPGELPLQLVSGDRGQLRERLQRGEVVIGSVLANRMDWKAGDVLEMTAVDGRRQVRIAGVTNEYLVGGQGVYAEWNAAELLFGIHGADGYIIHADRSQTAELQARLSALAQEHEILLHSSADIARHIDQIIAGIDAGLWGLVLLGFVVASFGVVNTLSMSVLEQTRELGMLRIIAMTRPQVRRTILAQAAIIGGVGLLPGVASGVSVAYVMNLAMEPSFGRPIEFGFHPWLLCFTLLGALAIVLIAARLPAERAARINVGEALHYE
jgi:putative ABC transport system permease protein